MQRVERHGKSGPLRPIMLVIGVALVAIATLLWVEAGGGPNAVAPDTETSIDDSRPESATDSRAETGGDATTASESAKRSVVVSSFDPAPLSNARFRFGLATFVGRLIDVRGAPLQGVHVEVTHPNLDQMMLLGTPHEVVTWVSAVTDADGKFETGGLWPRGAGDHLAKIGLSMPETGASDVRTVKVWPQSFGGRHELGDLVWDTERRLFGRVLDARGAPVAGARVTASFADGSWCWRMHHDSHFEAPQVTAERAPSVARDDGLREVTTGADGTFDFVGVVDRAYFVEVSTVGETFVRAVRDSVPPGDLGDIVLNARVLTGRVVDAATGSRLAAVEVMVEVAGSRVAGPFQRQLGRRMAPLGVTDASGQFRFTVPDAAAELPTRFATRRGPAHRWIAHSDIDPSREIVLEQPSDLGIDVRVVDAAGAVLDTGYELILAPADTPTVQAMSRPFPTWADLELDVAELARRLDDGTWRIEGLASGAYWIASLGGGQSSFAKFELRAGAEVKLELQHTRRPTRVHVRGPHGEAISHAQVITAPRQLGKDGALRLSGTTDADGQVDVWPLCDEEFVLTVRHPRLGDETRRLPIGTERTEVRFPGIGHVRGTLFLFGAECSELPCDLVVQPVRGDSANARKIQLGANGRFSLGMIPAGPYVITPRQTDGRFSHGMIPAVPYVNTPRQTGGVKRWNIAPDRFEVLHGGSLELEIRIEALPGEDTRGRATLRGKVEAKGLAESSLAVRVYDDHRPVVTAKVVGGRYQLEQVPTGTRRVDLVADAQWLMARDVQLLPGAFVDLDFVGEWGSITCKIEATPADLLAYRVHLKRAGGSRVRGQVVSADGETIWNGLDFGDYVVEVRGPGEKVVASQAATIDANTPRASVQIPVDVRFAVRWTVASEISSAIGSGNVRFEGPTTGIIPWVRGIGFCRIDPLPPGEYRVVVTAMGARSPLLESYESRQPIIVGSGVSELQLDLVAR